MVRIKHLVAGPFRQLSLPGFLGQPVVVHRRRQGSRDGAGADVSYDDQGLLERLVHLQHLVPPLGLLRRLLHQAVLVLVQVCQQLGVDEVLSL